MKILLKIIIAVVVIIGLLGVFAPKDYGIERSIEINKPVDEVYTYLTLLKNQDTWAPWVKKDPNIKQEFVGIDGTVGCISKWDSEVEEVGAGEQEITKLVPNERIESELRFLKPFESESIGYFNTSPTASGGTEVNWGFSGRSPFPFNIVMLFVDIDG